MEGDATVDEEVEDGAEAGAGWLSSEFAPSGCFGQRFFLVAEGRRGTTSERQAEWEDRTPK